METTNPPRESLVGAPRTDTNHNLREPTLSSPEDIQLHSGYKAVQAPRRPSYWGVDRDLSRRPGVPMMRPPELWPNARLDIEHMNPERSAVFKHGRPNKEWPPVFGTTCPPKGLSGSIRKWAASFPDHKPQHWLLKLLGDRVDSAEHNLKKLAPVALPLAAVALIFGLNRSSNASRRAFARPSPRRVPMAALRIPRGPDRPLGRRPLHQH